jgi:ABC-type dipeptide/oligopeptide/nickel transport system permease component
MSQGLAANVESVLLAVLVMSVHSAVLIGLQLRGSMVATLDSVHVRTARAVGLSPSVIYFNFALRAALPPVITYLPLVFAALVGSSTVVESVFNIPGLGLATVQAIDNRDYPTLQGIVLVLVLAVVALNVVADLVLVAIDPRLRRRLEADR